MAYFQGFSHFVGPDPAGANIRPASSLRLDDNGFLCQRFRQSLLGAQTYFRSRVELKNLPPVDVLWIGVAQTAGVALWIRESGIGAATIFLSDLDAGENLVAPVTLLRPTSFPSRRRSGPTLRACHARCSSPFTWTWQASLIP